MTHLRRSYIVVFGVLGPPDEAKKHYTKCALSKTVPIEYRSDLQLASRRHTVCLRCGCESSKQMRGMPSTFLSSGISSSGDVLMCRCRRFHPAARHLPSAHSGVAGVSSCACLGFSRTCLSVQMAPYTSCVSLTSGAGGVIHVAGLNDVRLPPAAAQWVEGFLI